MVPKSRIYLFINCKSQLPGIRRRTHPHDTRRGGETSFQETPRVDLSPGKYLPKPLSIDSKRKNKLRHMTRNHGADLLPLWVSKPRNQALELTAKIEKGPHGLRHPKLCFT